VDTGNALDEELAALIAQEDYLSKVVGKDADNVRKAVKLVSRLDDLSKDLSMQNTKDWSEVDGLVKDLSTPLHDLRTKHRQLDATIEVNAQLSSIGESWMIQRNLSQESDPKKRFCTLIELAVKLWAFWATQPSSGDRRGYPTELGFDAVRNMKSLNQRDFGVKCKNSHRPGVRMMKAQLNFLNASLYRLGYKGSAVREVHLLLQLQKHKLKTTSGKSDYHVCGKCEYPRQGSDAAECPKCGADDAWVKDKRAANKAKSLNKELAKIYQTKQAKLGKTYRGLDVGLSEQLACPNIITVSTFTDFIYPAIVSLFMNPDAILQEWMPDTKLSNGTKLLTTAGIPAQRG